MRTASNLPQCHCLATRISVHISIVHVKHSHAFSNGENPELQPTRRPYIWVKHSAFQYRKWPLVIL